MILTTGGSGFLGKTFLEKLVEKGFKNKIINIVNRNHSGVRGVIDVKVDLNNKEEIKSIIKSYNVKKVVHMAATLGWKKAPFSYFYKVNTLFTKLLAEVSAEVNVEKFVYVSSAGVYGKGRRYGLIDENFKPSPTDKYEKTKYMGELEVLRFSEKMNIVILRPGWIYGPGDKRTLKLFKAVNTGFFPLPSGKLAVQSPVFVEDVVRGIILSLNNTKISSGEIFNIAGEEVIPVDHMIKVIARNLGKKLFPLKIPLFLLKAGAIMMEIVFYPTNISPPITISKLAFFERSKPLSIEKAKKILGYFPEMKFEKGIELTLKWYKEKGYI